MYTHTRLPFPFLPTIPFEFATPDSTEERKMASPPTMVCKDSIFASHGRSRGFRFLFGPATSSSTTSTIPPDDEGQDHYTCEEGDQGTEGIYKLWSDLSPAEYQEAVAFLVANPRKAYPKKMEKDVQQAAAAAAFVALDSDSDSADVDMAEHKNHAATAPAAANNEEMEEKEQDESLEHGRGYGLDATQHDYGEKARSLADELMDIDTHSDQVDVDDDLRSSSYANDSDPQNDDEDYGDAATTQDQHQDHHDPHGTPLLRQDDIWHADSVVPSVQPLSQLEFQSMPAPTPTSTSVSSRFLSSVASAWSSSPVASSPLTVPSLTPPPQTTTTKTSTLSSSSPPPPAALSQAKRDRLKASISSSSSPFFHAGGGGVSTPPPQTHSQSPQQSDLPQQPEKPHHVQQLWDTRLVKALEAYDDYGDDEEEEEGQGGRDWVQHGQHQHRPQSQHGTRRDGGDSDGDVLKLRSSSRKVAGARRNKRSLWPEV